VAYILQLQSGQPFFEYVEDKVFPPLNKPNCSANPEFIRNHPNRAIGHMPYVKRETAHILNCSLLLGKGLSCFRIRFYDVKLT